MKLSHLRNFITVADQGGLRRAARFLGFDAPALTKSIRELEHELGVPLFERSTTGMVLTPIGEVFRRRSGAIYLELQRACDEVQQMLGVASGSVSVGLSTSAQIALLQRALRPFRKRYPNILVKLQEGLFPTMEMKVRQGTIDFYVGPPSEERLPSEFQVEKLFDMRMVVMGRSGHPLAHARSLKELSEAEWVATLPASNNELELYPIFEKFGLPRPKIRVEAQGSASAIMAVAYSDLLAMFPEPCLDFAKRTGLVQPIPLNEKLEAPAIYIISRLSLPLTPVAQHLADLFRRAALNRMDSVTNRHPDPFRH